ncbi:hypothetical protein, partial [Salinispora arenicola]|uniref:hypothetical protein n=1 Tax=Salinispora arenicola TaxID=168697 RepID=UPI0004767F73
MKPLHAPVLAVHSEPRAAVYRTLLSAPERDWSVSELAAATPEVSGEAARATLYQLLGDLLVKQVPHRR